MPLRLPGVVSLLRANVDDATIARHLAMLEERQFSLRPRSLPSSQALPRRFARQRCERVAPMWMSRHRFSRASAALNVLV